MCELLASGVTCINDMGTVRHTETIGAVLEESGIRAVFGKPLRARAPAAGSGACAGGAPGAVDGRGAWETAGATGRSKSGSESITGPSLPEAGSPAEAGASPRRPRRMTCL